MPDNQPHRCDHDCPPVGVDGAVPTGEIMPAAEDAYRRAARAALAVSHDGEPDNYAITALAHDPTHRATVDAARANLGVLVAVGHLYLDSLDADPENELLTLPEAYAVTMVREAVARWDSDEIMGGHRG